MKNKHECCTPEGQVPRYVDCKGCDKKPIETMSKQTVVNVLKEHIQDAIEKTVVDNHYESGYKQCLIDIQNKIDDGLLQMEKEQIVKSYRGGAEWQAKQMYSKDELADLIDATFQGRQDVADLFSELLKNLKNK